MWQASLQLGEPDTLNGKALFNEPELAVLGGPDSSIVGLYGDFSSYYIRDVGQPGPLASEKGMTQFAVRRLNERYADNMEVGFLGFHRTDGEQIDDNAVVAVQSGSVT